MLNALTACSLAQTQERQTIRERIKERLVERGNPQEVSTGMTQGELVYQGQTRVYHLYTQRGYNQNTPRPLVVAFHGCYCSGKRFAETTGFNTVADRKNFIVVYPDAVDKHWNDGRSTPNPDIDDVGFTKALIDHLGTIRNTDRSRGLRHWNLKRRTYGSETSL